MVVSYQAVLLIAFGGPTSSEEIRPFLERVTQGAAIPPQRLEDVARHYEALGGKSPLNEITSRQARAVQKLLRDRGMGFSVYVGMRNAAPFFVDVLRQMARDGIERALGFILSSHHTDASWGRYQRNVADARLEIDVRWTRNWLNQIEGAQPERDPGQDHGSETRKDDSPCDAHTILLGALDSPAQPVPVGHLSPSLALRISTSSRHTGAIELFEMSRNLGDHRAPLRRREIETCQTVGDKTFKIRHPKTSPGG